MIYLVYSLFLNSFKIRKFTYPFTADKFFPRIIDCKKRKPNDNEVCKDKVKIVDGYYEEGEAEKRLEVSKNTFKEEAIKIYSRAIKLN